MSIATRHSIGVMMSLAMLAAATRAQITPAPTAKAGKADSSSESPWLLAPIFSASPKLGVSLGALGGYMYYFDPKSQVSIFGLQAQVTSTKSVVLGAFAKLSWAEDHQRLVAAFAAGQIVNNYDDYLGTGQPLHTQDELQAFVARYLYRVTGDLFVGAQGAYTSYYVSGESEFDQDVIDILGVTGFTSGGLGLAVYTDSRDNEFSPSHGILLNANNIAYRDWLGGAQNFDVYRVDFRLFLPERGGSVFAARQYNQFTSNAPTAAYAPVQLRGYTMGEYLGKNMSSVEVEERLRLGERWTATGFTGVALLYGNGQDVASASSYYPTIGAGIQYLLKPKQGIVANLEFADGSGATYGIYLKMGYSF